MSTDCYSHPERCRDGAPARGNPIKPVGLALDSAGNLYVGTTYERRVRMVTASGILTTVVGTGVEGFSGDGGPATAAQLRGYDGIALDSKDNLYIADTHNHRIRMVNRAGIITTIAGTGATADTGDGGLAINAGLLVPQWIALDRHENIYVANGSSIRRIDASGIITTVVRASHLSSPLPDDEGNLYYIDGFGKRVQKLGPDGRTTTVIGGDDYGISPDGTLASRAQLVNASHLALDRAGNLYVSTQPGFGYGTNSHVRVVGPDGILSTFAGDGTLPFQGQDGPPTGMGIGVPAQLVFDSLGNAYIADNGAGHPGHVLKVSPALPGFTAADIAVPAEDGRELFVFNRVGRHLRTLDTLTAATHYQFAYDDAGRLTSVTDGDGNVTTVERDGTGKPTAVLGPYGHRTTLALDANGFLSRITDPLGGATALTSSPGGRLLTMADPKGNTDRFTHDALGFLTRDENAAGGFLALSRTETAGIDPTTTVTVTTAAGRTTTYLVEQFATGAERSTTTDALGLTATTTVDPDGREQALDPDGTHRAVTPGADPRFGLMAPIETTSVVTSPNGLIFTQTTARTAELAAPNNPLSLTSLTDTASVNGKTYTDVYVAATRTATTTTPLGRRQVTTIDAQGRPVQVGLGDLLPTTAAYDARGRLTRVSQGSDVTARSTSYAYGADGLVQSVTDALGRATGFTHDAAGRLTAEAHPDGRTTSYTYDANDNVTGVTPPGRLTHSFTYDAADRIQTYTPPAVGGAGNLTYTYDLDGRLTRLARADGTQVDVTYDALGRETAVGLARGTVATVYAPSGTVSSVAAPGGITTAFVYDGSLATGATWAGPVAGSVGATYDADFRVTAQSVNGGGSVSFAYDDDGLLKQAGSLNISRTLATGLITGTTLGAFADGRTYNGFGEVTTYTAGPAGLYTVAHTYDNLGRVVGQTETISGTTAVYAYTYDPAGRLVGVTKDGTSLAAYTYDANGNRLSTTGSGGTLAATYDAQDRLLTSGPATYTHTAAGERLSRGVAGATTTYTYDELGNLLRVVLPGGQMIDYVVDGLDRRIGKRVGGTLVRGFLYADALSPLAELDGAGNVVSRFVYGTRHNTPDYMLRGGVTYRIVSDQLGSPRLVVDVATGTVAQRLDYDAFGVVTQDTNPGFQPFGFAGGLYDPDTGLVRFGARDYDAETGRWTAKDPILFDSNGTNLYVYADNDPINLIDLDGLEPQPFQGIGPDGRSTLGGDSQPAGPGPVTGVGQKLGKHGERFREGYNYPYRTPDGRTIPYRPQGTNLEPGKSGFKTPKGDPYATTGSGKSRKGAHHIPTIKPPKITLPKPKPKMDPKGKDRRPKLCPVR